MDHIYYTLGLDIGIASVGWAVLENDLNGDPKKIIALGSRVFDKAENPKDGSSLAAPRRAARGARRVVRRRRHRKERIKALIENCGLMTMQDMETLLSSGAYKKDVYEIRVEALDRCLDEQEFVRLLIHFAQRRGYKSNSRSEEAKDAKENGAVKSAISENRQRMIENGYRTVGEMYLKDNMFQRVNPDGSIVRIVHNDPDHYRVTVERSMLREEIELVFAKQREYGNTWATEVFEKEYLDIWSSQRNFDEGPGGNSPYGGNQIERMLGKCTFEPDELRAPKSAYSAEYFRLLQWLNSIKLVKAGEQAQSLTGEQRTIVHELAFKSAGMTYTMIRKKLGLDDDVYFNMLSYGNKEKAEIEKKKPNHLQFWHKLRTTLKLSAPGKELSVEQLDQIAYILCVHKNDDNRRRELSQVGVSDNYIEKILELSVSNAAHLSLKAIRKLNPFLEKGMTYDKACVEVYGKHDGPAKDERTEKLHIDMAGELKNPVVRRAVSQSIKVINAVVRTYGRPETVRVELARELGKDFNSRNKITKKQNDNAAENERVKAQIREYKRNDVVTGLDIVKFRLFQEQNGVCLYSGKSLAMSRLFDAGYADVDHIIPYSISFDDSYTNKVLVLASENRQKRNRTPYEYLGADEERWLAFTTLVHTQVRNFKKRQNLLSKTTGYESREQMRKRNLNDTQYLSRAVYSLINDHLAFEDRGHYKKKTQTVSGSVTAYVRKRLGLEKIRENGDLHHAMDAAVIACVSPGMVAKVTRHAQRCERYRQGDEYINYETGELLSKEDFDRIYAPRFPEPWPRFRDELEARLSDDPAREINARKLYMYEGELPKPVFVSRMPRHKVTGAAHQETIRSGRVKGGTLSKVDLSSLKLDKNGEIEGYYRPEDDLLLYEALKKRLMEFNGDGKNAFAAGLEFHKPKHNGEQGPVVKRVKIWEKSTMNVDTGRGLASNGSMIRVDVFKVEGEGYYFVPIYIADTVKADLPNKAVVAHKSYDQWKEMDEKNFVFSIYPGDLLHIYSSKGIKLLPNKGVIGVSEYECKDALVYYSSLDIAGGSLKITSHDRKFFIKGLGGKSLNLIEKFEVDILGNIIKVSIPEKRMRFK